MTEKQMTRTSWTTISTGIVLQIAGLFDALSELEPRWMAFYLLSLPLLLSGYYLGLQEKGYRPHKLSSFYGMAFTVIVPYIGSVAVARKLFFTPRQGAAPDKKSWQVSLMSALSTTALDREEVETQSKRGFAEVKEAREKDIR